MTRARGGRPPGAAAAALCCAAAALCACGGGGGGGADAGGDDGRDGGDAWPEMCTRHPNTCWSGPGGPEGEYDCCRPPKTCCGLCFPTEGCGAQTECLSECPEAIPCGGIPAHGYLACYYKRSDIAGTAYCPVPETPGATVPVACAGSCASGVVCPLPETYGDAALCCPTGWSCEVVTGYNLPRCAAPGS